MKTISNSSREKEWRHKLLIFISGLILFETLTGLLVYFLPFSLTNQVNVLMHTIIGIIFIFPFLWYLIRHWMVYQMMPMNHFKFTGYILMICLIILIVSGLLLTYQAVFSVRISRTWDLIHTGSTFAMIAFMVPHVLLIVIGNLMARHKPALKDISRATNYYIKAIFGLGALLLVLMALWIYSYEEPVLNNNFPEDYSYLYGQDRPFAPSLATTTSGGAFDSRSLGGSGSCGTKGCHEEIYNEWQISAHRYASMDVGFQVIQNAMAEQNGPESTRYCGGCHDPISLFSGTKNIGVANLSGLTGYQEGISCIACHSITQTDIKGNADYVIKQPGRYMYEQDSGNTAKFISDFLIRAYPENHIETFQHKLFKSPEFCAACHKQFIDEEVNNVGWVQLQNQYDNWKNSRWNHPGDPLKTIECRECHMPLIASIEPASGDNLDYNRTPADGKHRSHRFLGANQFIPAVMELPGAQEHVELTHKWLQGKIEIPEIADKWKSGPSVPVELIVPKKVSPEQKVVVQVIVTNNKVGHDFPTGPLDIIQAWVELTVTDQEGNKIFTSGHIDERKFIQPGSFIFKVEPVDQYGNLIDKHNLWEMVGVRFRRSMFPGFSDKAEYTFACPASIRTLENIPTPGDLSSEFDFRVSGNHVNRLTVTARLLYRKYDQYLINYMFGESTGLTAPITVLSEDKKIVEVGPG